MHAYSGSKLRVPTAAFQLSWGDGTEVKVFIYHALRFYHLNRILQTLYMRHIRLIEYLGDVNYFLEKRKARDMREVEKRSVVSNNGNGVAVPTLDAEERKNLQRTVQRTERRIADLEKDMAQVEQKMAAADFYNSKDADATLKKYADMKAELEKIYAEWETAVEQLG